MVREPPFPTRGCALLCAFHDRLHHPDKRMLLLFEIYGWGNRGLAKIKRKPHSLWDLLAAGLCFSVPKMGITRMPRSEPGPAIRRGSGQTSGSSPSGAHHGRKELALLKKGRKREGVGALRSQRVGVFCDFAGKFCAGPVECGAWGVGCGAESSRSQPKHCSWHLETQRGSLCSRRPERSRQAKPGATRSCHSAAPGSQRRCVCLSSRLSVSAVPQGRASRPRERGTWQEVCRAMACGEPREAPRPQSGRGEGARSLRQGNGLSPGRGSGPRFEFSPP